MSKPARKRTIVMLMELTYDPRDYSARALGNIIREKLAGRMPFVDVEVRELAKDEINKLNTDDCS